MSILKICDSIKAAVRDYAYSDGIPVVVGDIYDVNNAPSVKYPMVIISQGKHTFDNRNDYLYYNLTLFYIDNMGTGLSYDEADYTDNLNDVNTLSDNILSIQSAGTKCLLSALYRLEDKYVIDGSLQVVPFKEKFNDVCAGVYVEIRIREDVTHCDVTGGR